MKFILFQQVLASSDVFRGRTVSAFIKRVEFVVEHLIWGSRHAMFFAVVACLIAYFAVLAMTIVDLVQFVLPVYRKYSS
ncbi:MAG: hypothetical protein QOF14_595 [Hyphomicrobiales bacterium]|jgi:hypothetical protein|nr:hypothetical protein [Hyphomicrobiales bacterium]